MRGERYPYSFKPDEKRPFPWESAPHPIEIAHEVFQAWLTFAVFDNARRARVGSTLPEYRAGIGRMMAPMTAVAAANPDAWFPVERSPEELVTPSPDNRMVGYPYTKYTVAVMDVDMAGALILATHERADALGVPPEQRVYLRGWCYATDPVLVAAHRDMTASPAMTAASSEALRVAGIGVDDVALFDLYSCFASSLHFGCDALGIQPVDARGLTVTGGLPYHGGPASGYLTHSIAEVVRRLRARPADFGMVSGVGMHMTKHVFGVYSTTPGRLVPPDEPAVQARLDGANAVDVVAEHEGSATVAAYSVVHGRDGGPEWALLVCDVGERARTYAQCRDVDLCLEAEAVELVGRTVTLTPMTVQGVMGEARMNVATW
jgi:acetyl-CoA C-acetyltransferase